MSYKKSVKLLISNFKLVWKQLLYMLSVVVVLFLLGYASSIPMINLLKENGVFKEFSNIFQTIYTAPKDVVNAMSLAFENLSSTITNNFGDVWFSFFSSVIIVGAGFQFLKHISFYNLSSLMYMQMSSFVEIGYTRNMISTFRQSIRYALAKLVYQIPFILIKALIFFLYFHVVSTPLGILIGLFIVILLLIVLNSVEISLFSGMAPQMLKNEGNISAFKAFFTSNKLIMKNFARVFSNAIIVTLTLIVLNMFLGIFTIGVALLITLPASTLFKAIFGLTTHFGVNGERYYLSSTVITTPVTEENETIKKL